MMRTICRTLGLRRLAVRLAMLAACANAVPSWADKPAQQTFSSPETAAEALASAWRSGNTDTLLALFGPAGAKLVKSGDPIGEQIARSKLASVYDEAHQIERSADDHAVILLGKDEWPYPIPLAMRGTRWRFDTKAGAQQIIDRRVGHHEAHAIRVCRAYVEAQLAYGASHRTVDGRAEFAQRLDSSTGKHDGLFWVPSAGDEESPLGPLIALADARHQATSGAGKAIPFHGYLFRILTRQGKHAPGGARGYVDGGQMTGGFALVAFPATFGASGVMTFIVNQDGVVYQRNLGPHTAEIARHMRTYDPDENWSPALP
ncbi:DUF2950 domain-containing protein [Ralstonia sp. CHL-2022]|uniref:DUF2950 domain-containing protein n=1 Tax=Ralstonia mojiangensis TaxID=2953895 RepID=A0AAE3LGI4_9RALS|nr:DUF2950 domain-containing protein [Ralstonia mojiangensis]MCT7318696.1 DUF2950 domain-containing protein [Ralstonia mojiangensis]